ncbi:MAG: hypothetical protein PHS34_07575 [Candidatus Omnitrophica bacterium]|nr:hypothetical protein [Candidatus Omnitrophota bacterium]
MTTIEFAKKAIKNGYNRVGCNGWDWIRKNIHELDYIFQSDDYKTQKGMKYLCMPFLQTDDMSPNEIDAIGTAWFVNNEREHEKSEQEKNNKLKEQGYIKLLGNEKELDNRKIEFIIDSTDDLFGGLSKKKGVLRWIEKENCLWAFETRHTRTGYPIWRGCNVYIKLS